jgi:1,2-diacylglycerol 3-alpha-glucosyltransferase
MVSESQDRAPREAGPVKIALVTDTYLPRINGVSTAVTTLAHELRVLGCEVQVWAPEFPDYVDEAPDVHRVPSWYLALDPEDRLANPWHRRTAESFASQRFDLIHTQTPFSLGLAALGWAKQSGARVVHTYHTRFSSYTGSYLGLIPRGISGRMVQVLSKRYCDACDLVVAPSSPIRDELLAFQVRTKVEVIPTGIATANFRHTSPDSFRRLHGFEPDDRCLLFVGRLAQEKNIDFLLYALREIARRDDRAKLLLAGDGPAKCHLRALAQELGIWERVHFLGYLHGAELADCYAAADLFVFSSVTETQGLVVLEALAAGTPVVAVEGMGVSETLAAGRGGILTRPDVDEFADTVVSMLTDQHLYEGKKSECLDEAEKWSSANTARRMLDVYETLG